MYYRLSRRHNYIYYSAVGLSVLLIGLLQGVPVFPRLFGVYPLPLIALTVCVAAFNSEVTGFMTGLACGIIMDITSPAPDGFNALFLMIAGLALGLLTELLFNDRFVTTAILSFATVAAYYIIYWLIRIVPMGVQGVGYYLVRYSLPAAVYTWCFTVPCFFSARWFSRKSLSDKPIGSGRGGLK